MSTPELLTAFEREVLNLERKTIDGNDTEGDLASYMIAHDNLAKTLRELGKIAEQFAKSERLSGYTSLEAKAAGAVFWLNADGVIRQKDNAKALARLEEAERVTAHVQSCLKVCEQTALADLERLKRARRLSLDRYDVLVDIWRRADDVLIAGDDPHRACVAIAELANKAVNPKITL